MMKKTILCSVLAALCLNFCAKAQPNTPLKALANGEPVPDLPLKNLLNYHAKDGRPVTSARLSDFRGKLLILDFWASWCSNCIDAMPRLERLQARYPDKLLVLGVNDEPKEKVQQFFKRRNAHGQPLHFPTVYGDTTLAQLFPHRSIPHYAWIGPDGKFITTTSAEELNESNIEKALERGTNTMTVKKDIDPGQPLFLQQDFPMDSLLHYSIFLKYYYPGVGVTARERRKNGQAVGQAITGYSLIHLYQFIGSKLFKRSGESFTPKRMLLETKDSAKLRKEDELVRNPELSQRPSYNYDLIVPVAQRDSLYEIMLTDINRYSGYQGRIEQRTLKCLALQRTADYRDLTSKGGEALTLVLNGTAAKHQNQVIGNLVARLNEVPAITLPVIDETNIQNKVDLRFSGATDLATLNTELQQQGLTLTEKLKSLPVLILTDPVNTH